MKSELKIFENDKFGKVRIAGTSENPLFCLADVAKCLDIRNVSDLKTRLNQKGVVTTDTLTNGGEQKMVFINEPNLYKCVFQSRKEEAEQFQDWICEEVLPSIRKTGGFVNDSSTFVDSYFSDLDDSAKQFLVQTLDSKKKLLEENKKQQQQIEVMKPKVEFFDQVTDSKDACDMATVAKVLNMGIGRNKLFEILRDNKILQGNNQPMQRYVDAGWFRVVESQYTKPSGDICINFKTIVYQRGIEGIRKVLRDNQ